jgi:hypothetical protein
MIYVKKTLPGRSLGAFAAVTQQTHGLGEQEDDQRQQAQFRQQGLKNRVR